MSAFTSLSEFWQTMLPFIMLVEFVLFTAVFLRQSNGKVNCRKENGSGKYQPRCIQQKCVPDIIGICLGNGEQQWNHHRHNRQTQQAAHRLIATKKLIHKQPDFKDDLHKHDKRQHSLPKFRNGRKCTHFLSPSFVSNTRRWYSSSSSFSQRILSPLTKGERSALQHTFSDKRKPFAFMRLTCMPVKFKMSAVKKRTTRNTSTLYLKRKKVTGNECIFFPF